jgi:hypothetical protein
MQKVLVLSAVVTGNRFIIYASYIMAAHYVGKKMSSATVPEQGPSFKFTNYPQIFSLQATFKERFG